MTQTNEVRRSTALLPGIRVAAGLLGERRLGVVDVGASAGLNLLADRYPLREVAEDATQPKPTPVTVPPVLTCGLRGARRPPREPAVAVVDRVGLDRHPLNAGNPEDARWLRACVWPEHTTRRELLDAALAVALADPPELVRGDAVADLEDAVDRIDAPAVCVMHSASLVYLDAKGRAAFEETLPRIAATRRLARVSLEGPIEPFASLHRQVAGGAPPGDTMLLGVSVWPGGQPEHHLLARADPHGAWLEWLS